MGAAIRLVRQPEESSLCGQACVAMAAGVSLDRAIEAVGHKKVRGTYTRELVAALRSLGFNCTERAHRISRARPVLPKRAIVSIHRPRVGKKGLPGYQSPRYHWMLTWDGEMYDPDNCWGTSFYKDWKITSYLEIF